MCVYVECEVVVGRGRPERDLDLVGFGCLAGWSVICGGSL